MDRHTHSSSAFYFWLIARICFNLIQCAASVRIACFFLIYSNLNSRVETEREKEIGGEGWSHLPSFVIVTFLLWGRILLVLLLSFYCFWSIEACVLFARPLFVVIVVSDAIVSVCMFCLAFVGAFVGVVVAMAMPTFQLHFTPIAI